MASPPTDTTEKGLENLIVAAMTGQTAPPAPTDGVVKDPTPTYGGTGWILGSSADYERQYALATLGQAMVLGADAQGHHAQSLEASLERLERVRGVRKLCTQETMSAGTDGGRTLARLRYASSRRASATSMSKRLATSSWFRIRVMRSPAGSQPRQSGSYAI
ncbi:MAG TPA: hypothetical protein VFC51_04235 [Chloroflexota bacterium]|nr:hypothetical protein [Chloroflexota bacterium]